MEAPYILISTINSLRYSNFIAIADPRDCGKDYPLSIAEGMSLSKCCF